MSATKFRSFVPHCKPVMSQRSLRVNELIKREVSQLLRTAYREEAVAITITAVEVAPDLRQARIYYSVLGDDEAQARADHFLNRRKESLRREVGKVVRLKYLPHFRFFHDASLARGSRLMDVLDELDQENDSGQAPE